MTAILHIDGRRAPAAPGQTVFRCAAAIGVHVPTSCVEQGSCRECLVEVEEGAGHLSPRTEAEAHLPDRFRLSCQARFVAAGAVRCHTLRRGDLRIETDGAPLAVEVAPSVPLDGPDPVLGVAMDLGTTTVVLRQHDLRTGAILGTVAFENPQRFGGSDVMARIRFDGEHRGRLLQRTLIGYLGRALARLPGDPAHVRELVVAANTTMRDLLFGLDVQPVGQWPYRSVTEVALREGRASTTTVCRPARRLRLPLHAEAAVVGLPLLGGHAGGDAAACLLASGILESDRPMVVMDIGTNVEILVGDRHRVVVASCPAGPAFEGGRVACGMPALEGAIERVRIEGDAVRVGVIGEGKPVGICGSGLVDALAELRRTGLIDSRGRFEDEDDAPFVLADGVVLTEPDIAELAQAKGAAVAGLGVALSAAGVGLGDIDRLVLAGGFARHLDLEAARRIGLVPALAADRIHQVGNAALDGASEALLNRERRALLETWSRRVERVELETDPSFFDRFTDGCQLVPVTL